MCAKRTDRFFSARTGVSLCERVPQKFCFVPCAKLQTVYGHTFCRISLHTILKQAMFAKGTAHFEKLTGEVERKQLWCGMNHVQIVNLFSF